MKRNVIETKNKTQKKVREQKQCREIGCIDETRKSVEILENRLTGEIGAKKGENGAARVFIAFVQNGKKKHISADDGSRCLTWFVVSAIPLNFASLSIARQTFVSVRRMQWGCKQLCVCVFWGGLLILF